MVDIHPCIVIDTSMILPVTSLLSAFISCILFPTVLFLRRIFNLLPETFVDNELSCFHANWQSIVYNHSNPLCFMFQEHKAYSKQLQIQQFDSANFSATIDQQSNLIIDQVYYGPYNYPVTAESYLTFPPLSAGVTGGVTGGVPAGFPLQAPCPFCPQYLQCS